MEKEILDQLNWEYFKGNALSPSFKQRKKFMKLTDSWCILLLFSTAKGFIEKDLYSGNCDVKFIRFHPEKQLWNADKGEQRNGIPLSEFETQLVHPQAENFNEVLEYLSEEKKRILIEYFQKGDILSAYSFVAEICDSGTLKEDICYRLYCKADINIVLLAEIFPDFVNKD